ncbi:MAG TPA: YceI family protein [Gemmatimonadales bacterium]|mgnify:CR=1 FL=1|jgi:polyisoprenoid-binding protein YceI|nr:YceI family protein [Gemmatimonadales bacterium]
MTTETALRTWKIDPSHSSVEFSARHLMITTVKGSFAEFDGTIEFDPTHVASGRAQVSIAVASIGTRSTDRDTHLRSPDFLDAEQHPTISFVSTRVEPSSADANAFTLVGDLTIRGVSKEVRLATTFEGQGKDPWGNERVSFLASTTIDRRDFGLTWNAALESGGVLVSNEIKLTLDVQAIGA